MTDNAMVLGDDGSAGADLAWRWIMAHRWPGWSLEVVTAAEAFHSALIVSTDAPMRDWHPATKRNS
jgi:hypothetical protein